MLNTLLGIGGSLLTGALNNKAAKDMAQTNWGNEKLVLQEQIRWKARDAELAGIHPVFALGSPPYQYSGGSVGGNPYPDMGQHFSDMGADLSKYIMGPKTQADRTGTARVATKLALEKGGLENELLRTQIRRLQTELPPAVPPVIPSTGKEGPTTLRGPGGGTLAINDQTSSPDIYRRILGDDMFDNIMGPWRAFQATLDDVARRYNQGGFTIRGQKPWKGSWISPYFDYSGRTPPFRATRGSGKKWYGRGSNWSR